MRDAAGYGSVQRETEKTAKEEERYVKRVIYCVHRYDQ